jgi:hypothetical protein
MRAALVDARNYGGFGLWNGEAVARTRREAERRVTAG